MNMNKVNTVVTFLQNKYGQIQCFNTRNFAGDMMTTVYNIDGVQIDFCPEYYYVEIFGLSPLEFHDVEARVWINSTQCRKFYEL